MEICKYEPWKNAKLADGTLKPLISGYCVANVVLKTKAGKVLLPQTHIDILQGPEDGNLLYVGQVEEARLGLRSFKAQIESLASEIQDGKRKQKTQKYHGRGTCHSHSLDFLQRLTVRSYVPKC